MKIEILKNLIKQSVKEAIREEMKDILLEAIKSNKQPINEYKPIPTFSSPSNPQPSNKPISKPITKQSYMEILDEMARGPKSGLEGKFEPKGVDPLSGDLPPGQVDLDQIMNLINK